MQGHEDVRLAVAVIVENLDRTVDDDEEIDAALSAFEQ